jgi:hypothetical protein
MGGGSSQHAADPATQATASAGANAQAQAAANLSNTYNQEQQQQYKTLFGGGGSTDSGGTLSKLLDPSTFQNIHGPTGAYALQYKQAVGNLAQQTSAQRGQLRQQEANEGWGTNSPSGMAQDANLQLELGQNAQQGQLFTQAATNSYNDALSNFWNATNIAAGQAATSQAGALGANAQSAQTYSNLYGSATQPYTTTSVSPFGAIAGAAGQAGSAAIMCTAEGTLILMFDGTEQHVERIRSGDQLMGIDGQPCFVQSDPESRFTECVEVGVDERKVVVSEAHTFQLERGGYTFASDTLGQKLFTSFDGDAINFAEHVGEKKVFFLDINGSHTYRANGFWSLS